MIDRVRRVVMGEPTAGSSEFTHVEEVAPRTTPTDAAPYTYDVWGWDETPTLPHADRAPYPGMSLFPKTGGLRVLMMTFPPNWELPAGPGATVRYTMKLADGAWSEIGERTADGGKTWNKFFEMALKKKA